MKMWFVLLLVAFIVTVMIVGLRRERGSPLRRQFPGPNAGAANDGADTSLLYTAGASGAESSHHHAGHHGADCAPSHDGGAGCSADGGGGGSH